VTNSVVDSSSSHVRTSPAVGRLGRELSPRYHFAGGGGDQTRPTFTLPPYRNHIGVSRFYGIESPNKTSGKVKVKAFGIPIVQPSVSTDTEARSKESVVAATNNPYSSERFIPTHFLTVASRKPEDKANAAKLTPLEPPAPVGEMDEMHTQLASGDWKCGYCDNMNRARYKQTERCNMKFCMAPRYLGPHDTGGSLSAAAAKVLQLQLAEAAEARKNQELIEKEKMKQAKLEAELEAAKQGGEKKSKKRESIYADQGGGLSNPKKNRYKKGGRPGDPSGPSHSRVKW